MVNPVACTTKKANVKASENCVEGGCKARKRGKWVFSPYEVSSS